MANEDKDKLVISVGGSLIVPDGGINIKFLSKFNKFIRKRLAENKNHQFFIVVGGGATSKHYRTAGKNVTGYDLTQDEIDKLGIQATLLNAQLMRTIFKDIAHPYILKHYEIIRKVTEPIIIGSGWKPGLSIDFCATMICEDYKVKTIVNLSSIAMVYNKDPQKYPKAKPIRKMNYDEFRKIVGNKWTPKMHLPFDPVASKKAQELGLKVVILKGDNFANLENYFQGKKFAGTLLF